MSHLFIAVVVLGAMALAVGLALGGEIKGHVSRAWANHCEDLITTGFVAGVQYATTGVMPSDVAELQGT